MELKSSAFKNGEMIPELYTGEDKDISPELVWDDIPEGTKSFALIMDDPDAPGGTWTHWVAYDIPKDARMLKEAVPKRPVLERGIKQGVTSFRDIGYGGPYPPPGKPHRYVFKLYALDIGSDIEPGLPAETLMGKIENNILEEAVLTGLFERR